MKKKKLILIIAIVCVIIAGIIVFINTKNSNQEDTQEETRYKEYTSAEWKEYAKVCYEQTTGKTPANIELYSDGKDIMIIEIYDSVDEGAQFIERYNLNYKTGTGTDLVGNVVDLKLK